MAPLTSDQIAAELQRKRNLGISPTNAANQAAYNALKPKTAIGTGTNQTVKPTPLSTPKINDGNVSVRNYFEQNGYKDVGWDPSRKMVTVGGMDALSPGQIVGGSSYASGDALQGALSGIQNRESTTKTNALLKQLEERMSKPYEAPKFDYTDAQMQADPAYQAAISRANANAQTASGNAMAELNRRGILNSTITSDRMGQIQQGEMGRVSSEIVPQLIAQAYQRHRDTVGDQMSQERNAMADLGNLLGLNSSLNQQRQDNQYRSDTFNWQKDTDSRNFDRGVLESDRGYDYQVNRDKIGDEMWQTEFNHRVKQDGVQNALAWAQNSISQQNANTSSSSAAWQRDPTNPDNIYKNAQIDALKKELSGESKELQSELDGLYTGLESKQIDPNAAISEINGRQKMGFITPEEATKMKAFVQKYLEGGSSTPKPQTVDSKLLQMTPDQLLKAWETDPSGKAAGRAMYDWRSWVTDPRGLQSGTTYELWKSQYGPRL